MLASLHIKNFILIDSLDISFPESLVIITGQTGAGKSILLGALSLVTGAKADASMLSNPADNCIVEAEFLAVPERARAILEENDIDWDEGRLIIRRVVNTSGRSRCFVNDCPVTVQVLGDLSSCLVDIHSQHQSLLLTDHNFQLSILDYYAGNKDLLKNCRNTWTSLQSINSSLNELRTKLRLFREQSEYIEAQYRQLESANLREGELEDLEQEQKSLAGAESIKESLNSIKEIFNPSREAQLGLCSALKEIAKQLEKLTKYLPNAEGLLERLESSRIEIEDIGAEIEEIDNSIDLSQEHLIEVEERLSQLYSLMKKHNCSSIVELIALKEQYANSFSREEDLSEQIIELEKSLLSTQKQYEELSSLLHESRLHAAPRFAQEVLSDLRFLELDRASFSVELTEAKLGASGKDFVSFLFSASGAQPQDIAKCASGGEISRIMLSLKAMMARFVGMPTLIFDEIDTGVSGSVADKMGSMICRMGDKIQVFSITHLPQVAAKGSAHYLVSKEIDSEGKASSSIRQIQGEDRIKEIARLLSGATVTQAAIANAKSLLEACR